jgi:uncharacterized RmlC-like cupin family protein
LIIQITDELYIVNLASALEQDRLRLPVPAGTGANALRTGIEAIAYLLDGECAVYFDDHHLERRISVRAGKQMLMRCLLMYRRR